MFHNDKGRNLLWSAGPGAPEIYATDTYPAGLDCNRSSFPGLTDYRFLRDGTAFDFVRHAGNGTAAGDDSTP